MQKDNARIWTCFAIAALGFWLFPTPWTFGFKSVPLTVSNWICGILLIALGDLARRAPKGIWIGSIALIGIWLQFTPLVFWAPEGAAYLNDTFVGSLVLLLSLVLFPLPGQLPDGEPSVPPGWSYNPSSWPQRIVIAFIAFICWMASRYLAAYQLGYIDTVWDPFFTPGTKSVLESDVSRAFPVSDAGLGSMAYTLEFFSACIGGRNRWRTAPWVVLIFGILVIPVSLVSVILIILQPLAVGTWCTLCLFTAVCMLIAIPFAVAEVAATLQFLRRSNEGTFFYLLFKGGRSQGASKDTSSPSLDAPFLSLWNSARSGITFPWNLLLSAAVGISLMGAPTLFALRGAAVDGDPIAGALSAVVSVISMSEVIRKARYFNCLFGLWILVQLFWTEGSVTGHLYHLVAGVLLIALSFRQGPIRERLGA